MRFDIRFKAALVTLVVAGVTFPLTFVVWPPMVPPGASAAAQLMGYGLLTAECLAMGAGVAILAFGFPTARKLPVSPRLAFASYVGIGYYLVNWWTHDDLHIVAFSLDFTGLVWMSLALDYVFHAGMMVFAGVLALFFARILLGRSSAQPGDRAVALPVTLAAKAEEVMVR